MTKAEEKDLSKETEEGKAEQNVEPGNGKLLFFN